MAASYCIGRAAIEAGSTNAQRSGDDIHLLSAANSQHTPEVVFKIGPRSLIIIRSLRNHVGHEICFLIDWDTIFVIAVGVRSHMAAIEAGTRIVGRLHAIPIGKNSRVRTEGINTHEVAKPGRLQMPTYPIWCSLISIV